ncbi:MAG: BrnA antitoxin family protein [Candidatus Binataceae bacterium]
MRKKENIARFSAEAIRRRIARGESKTDWKRVNAMPQAEVERLANRDEGALPKDWDRSIVIGLPAPKRDIHIRLDGDVLDWFKAGGRRYQTRINAVLRAYVRSRTGQERAHRVKRRTSGLRRAG